MVPISQTSLETEPKPKPIEGCGRRCKSKSFDQISSRNKMLHRKIKRINWQLCNRVAAAMENPRIPVRYVTKKKIHRILVRHVTKKKTHRILVRYVTKKMLMTRL